MCVGRKHLHAEEMEQNVQPYNTKKLWFRSKQSPGGSSQESQAASWCHHAPTQASAGPARSCPGTGKAHKNGRAKKEGNRGNIKALISRSSLNMDSYLCIQERYTYAYCIFVTTCMPLSFPFHGLLSLL